MQATAGHYRIVDEYVVREGSSPLRERIAELFPVDTEYVVLDLDRTVHLGVTIGERLGWEIIADPQCDPSRDDAVFPIVGLRPPLHVAATILRGMRYWGIPGLLYAMTVRLGDRWELWRRGVVQFLGASYVERVQTLLRVVLMESAAGYTPDELDRFCERAWRRWRHRLVIDADVIEAIRTQCPHLKAVLLSSASTAPTVRHAACKLGVDGFVASDADVVRDGDREIYAAPVNVPLRWMRRRPPYLSRPGAVVHNAARNKIHLLQVRYPEVFAAGARSVAVTDNNYGEDRSWPDHFAHVIGLNSRHPFSPFVRVDSPCRSIQLVDAAPVEAAAEAGSSRRFPWHGQLDARVWDAATLGRAPVAAELRRLEEVLGELRAARRRLSQTVDARVRQAIATVGANVAERVDAYNRAAADQKAAIARELRALMRRARRIRNRVARAARECARIEYELARVHESAARILVTRKR